MRNHYHSAGVLVLAIVFHLAMATQVTTANGDEVASSESEVRAVEMAFAKTMADRDLKAFSTFLSPEVVFFSGQTVLRGPKAVLEAWAKFFDGADAPFSWEPESVAILDSGTLAFSSGPVLDPEGNRIGTFNSVWRLGADGWRVVFDRGCP